MTQFATALDTIEDEHTEDDERKATKSANDTNDCIRS
jgi:hypothetical protein